MAAFSADKNRNVVPRWRSVRESVSSPELSGSAEKPGSLANALVVDVDLNQRVDEWNRSKSLSFAADVVATAIAVQRHDVARDAAEFILSARHESLDALEEMARFVLNRGRAESVQADDPFDHIGAYARIRTSKAKLRSYPRNPLLWSDIGLEYAVLGQRRHAEAAVRTAAGLADSNRFVLRAATRCFVHGGSPDVALSYLRRSPRLVRDPWLLAAEIAVCNSIDEASPSVKHARNMIENGGWSPIDLSELASALASMESRGGNARRAKQLFKRSLDRPTENSVAQYEWAKRHGLVGEIVGELNLTSVARAFEATCWRQYQRSDWRSAATEAESWLRDEPFSSRPSTMGSFVCSVLLEDYERAIRFAERGRDANPEDFVLANNLVFSLALRGELDRAAKLFDSLIEPTNEKDRVVHAATAGLLSFRKQDAVGGRALYLKAVELARLLKDDRLRALALYFWASEERLADTVDAEAVAKTAIVELERASSADLVVLAKRLKAGAPRRK